MTDQFEPGDRVVVPWGLDDLAGTVERILDRGAKTSVDVLVTLPGSDEDESVTFPLDAVRRLDPDDLGDVGESGVWLNAFNYQEALHRAVSEVLGRTALRVEPGSDLVSNFHISGGRTDIEARLADGRILVIEAKKIRGITRSTVDRAVRQTLAWLARDPTTTAGLIVFSEQPDASASERLEHLLEDSPNLRSTIWRGNEDNQRLADALSSLAA